MRIVLAALSLSLVAAGCGGSSCPPGAATPGPDVVAPAPTAPAELAFPDDWVGRWYGTVDSAGPGAIEPFEMELHIEPIEQTDRYTWTIVYVLPNGRQERPYELLTVDADAGHYRVDEKNSIVIDAYLAGSTLHTQFSVGQAMITIRYIREGGAIVFDLVSTKLDPAIETGGVDGIPSVSVYPLAATQRAVLERR